MGVPLMPELAKKNLRNLAGLSSVQKAVQVKGNLQRWRITALLTT